MSLALQEHPHYQQLQGLAWLNTHLAGRKGIFQSETRGASTKDWEQTEGQLRNQGWQNSGHCCTA